MAKRKFETGDKVRVKIFRVRGEDAEEVKKRVGKTGTIQSHSSYEDHPYYVQFDEEGLEGCLFKASELDKVELLDES